MKKFFCILVALGSLLALSCGKNGEPGTVTEASLTVAPPSLSFVAVQAEAQTVTVTASGVEWNFKVPDTMTEWLKVDKTDEETLTVTVSDNTKPEKRTGSFTVVPIDNDDVKAKIISVSQEASSVEYKLTVNPSALTFDAENAPLQTVDVTTEGEGLKWTAAAEGDAASWITLTPKEGKLEVSVANNPDTKERVGNIIVTPSEESAGKKAIRVTQKGMVLPPSLSIDVENPETGLAFQRNGVAKDKEQIEVTAVKVNWDAKAVDANGASVTWFEIMVNKTNGLSNVGITMRPNPEFTERIGYIEITTDNEDVPGFKVKITQDAGLEHLSTLTGNVDVSDIVHAYGFVYPNQEWDAPDLASEWNIRLWTAGVSHDLIDYVSTGTGSYVEISLATEHMVYNYDDEYSLPEGVYTIAPHKEGEGRLAPLHVTAGYPGFYDFQHFGSWYTQLKDDKEAAIAPLTEGTITVSKVGTQYQFVFDCVDDVGYTITGSFTVDVPYEQQGMPAPQPPVIDPEEPL